MFAWQTKHESLALRTNLVRRGVQVEDKLCLFYGRVEEDGVHLFVKCKLVKEVWRDLSLEKERMALERITSVHVMFDFLWGLDEKKCILILTFWWLWWSNRNKVREGELADTAADVVRQARCCALEYHQVYAQGVASPDRTSWKYPPSDKIKFNLGGLHVPGESHAGWGVVARDADDTVLCARAGRKEYIADAFAAEVHAMAEVVSFSADMGMLRVIFETDSQLLADAMDLRKVDSSAYSAIIEDTKLQLKLWFSHHEITFCKRHANSVADELAKFGRLCDVNHSVQWESDVPANVAACALGDLPGHQ